MAHLARHSHFLLWRRMAHGDGASETCAQRRRQIRDPVSANDWMLRGWEPRPPPNLIPCGSACYESSKLPPLIANQSAQMPLTQGGKHFWTAIYIPLI